MRMWKNTCNVYMIHCRIALKTYARAGLTPDLAGQIFWSDTRRQAFKQLMSPYYLRTIYR